MLSGRVLDSRPKGSGFEPHRRHCVVSLSKNNNPSLVLVQPRKTRPYITERLLMGRKESNQTNKQNIFILKMVIFLSLLGKTVQLKQDSLITGSIPMDPIHSFIKGLHCKHQIAKSKTI